MSVDDDIAKNEPRSSCTWIWFDMRSACAVSKRDQQAGEASGTFSLRVVPRSRRATSRSAARSALSIVLVRPASCAAKPGCTVRQVPLRSQDAPFFVVGAPTIREFRIDRWECVHALGTPIAEFSCVGRDFIKVLREMIVVPPHSFAPSNWSGHVFFNT